jgi:hypothetical protein
MMIIKKYLFLILLLVAKLVSAQEGSAERSIPHEPVQKPTAWIFTSKANGKEKLLKTGDKVKVYVKRVNPKDRYLIRGILLDIDEDQLIVTDRQKEQQFISKLAVKRIIASGQDGLMKNLLGMLLIIAGSILGGIALLLILLSVAYSNSNSNANISISSLLLGAVGLLLVVIGTKMMDDNASTIIIKPFSDEWEVTEIAPPEKALPYQGQP